jgi:hypothetical protein
LTEFKLIVLLCKTRLSPQKAISINFLKMELPKNSNRPDQQQSSQDMSRRDFLKTLGRAFAVAAAGTIVSSCERFAARECPEACGACIKPEACLSGVICKQTVPEGCGQPPEGCCAPISL